MQINKNLTDESVLAEIGGRISQRRIVLELTQAELARQAGVAKRTVERIESGASAQMISMIRIFRVLDLLQNLERMIPETSPGPMDLLKSKGKIRKRASKSNKPAGDKTPWTWDEES